MTISTEERVRRTIEEVLETYRDLLPQLILVDLVTIVTDALATHPFVTRLVLAALDPDAPVRAMEAAFAGPASPAGSAPAPRDDRWSAADRFCDADELTAEQLALLRSAPEMIDPLAMRFADRASDRVTTADLIARGEQGLLAATRAFEPEHELPFECLAWGHIHGAMSSLVDEAAHGVAPGPGDLVARALADARRAAYEMLASAEVLDEDGEPEPVGLAPDDQLGRYLGTVMVAACLTVAGTIARGGLRPIRGGRSE